MTGSDSQAANIPATGVPTISGTAQVGHTLTADTSAVADADGLSDVSYAYQWIRTDGDADADIAGATDSTYTLTYDDQGKTVKVKVTFNDGKANRETLTSAATAEVGESEPKPQFLVSNLGVGVGGSGGIQRTLGAARSGFAQAFTTGAKTGGYPLGSVGIRVSHFFDGATVGDHLQVTINGVAGGGGPGDAHCALTNPSSFPAPGVNTFEAPTGAGSCPQLATETTYFVVIEWVDPSGADRFALIPQTYSTRESAATGEDPGGAEGWSIADRSYYLTVSSNARTWTEYDERASFKIEVKEANSPATGLPVISGTAQVGETLTANTSGLADADGLSGVTYSYQWLAVDADIQDATGSTYTLTDADVGKAIKVRVTFTDDKNNRETLTSAATATVSAALSEPEAPQRLRVSPRDAQGLDVSWEPPASDGGSPVTGYRVQWKEASASWDAPADVSEATVAGDTAHTINGLTGGVAYAVRVIAVNEMGDGRASAEKSGTPAGKPELAPVSGPQHLTNALWRWGGQGHNLLDIDFTVHSDARPDEHGLYFMLAQSSIGGATFYLGLQTNMLKPGTGFVGKGVIFSRWQTRDLANARVAPTGYAQSAGYEGDFIGVRRPYNWSPGDYRARLERYDSDERGDWFGLWITDIGNGNTTWMGSLRFPRPAEEPVRIGPVVASFVEVYGPAPRLPAEIPQWHVSLKPPTGNWDSWPSQVTMEYPSERVNNTEIRFDEDDNSVHMIVGATTARVTEHQAGGTKLMLQPGNAPAPRPAPTAPAISGTAQAGETLTADTSGITDADGLGNPEFSYQWISKDGKQRRGHRG